MEKAMLLLEKGMIVIIFLSFFAGPCGIRSDILSGHTFIQREDSDSVERRSTNTMATIPVNHVFCLWHMCWYGWWLAWSWWRFHIGTSFSRVRNPSSGTTFHPSTTEYSWLRFLDNIVSGYFVFYAGVKCHSYFCHDIFCIYVSGRILPFESVSHSL